MNDHDFQALADRLRERKLPTPPTDLAARIREQAQQRRVAYKRQRWLTMTRWAAVGLLTISLVAWARWQRLRSEQLLFWQESATPIYQGLGFVRQSISEEISCLSKEVTTSLWKPQPSTEPIDTIKENWYDTWEKLHLFINADNDADLLDRLPG